MPHNNSGHELERTSLSQEMLDLRLNRRKLLIGAAAFGSTAALLAACEADDDDDPVAETDEEDEDEPDVAEEPDEEDAAEDEPEEEGTDDQYGGTLNVALNADLTTMDPHMSTAAVDRQVYQNVFDKLVDIDENLEIIPELADSWDISDEGDEYTFHLVEGVEFHDGDVFNAEAAMINFERMLDEEMGSPRRAEILQVEDVEVVDEQTLTLHLESAFSPLLATLSDRAGMMISPTAIDELGDDLARQPVGTGGFTFVEWVTDDHLTLTRNDDYWKEGLPYLDEIVYRPITDAAVRLTSLQTDEVQIIDDISARDIEQAQSDPDLVYSEVPGLAFTYIQLNHQVEPLDNLDLRQAIAWTIDREAINDTLFFGTGDPAQTPVPPSSWAYDESVQVYQQDYDMAQQKLEDGGMPDGFSFSMMVTNTPDAIQLAEAYQDQMAQAGIEVELELLEFGTLLDRLNAEDFEAVSLAWSGRPDPDGNIYGYFHSEGGFNRAGYSNPEVDDLLDQTRAVTDQDERRELYSQLTTIVAEEVGMIFIRFPGQIKIHQPRVQGFAHIPDGMMRFNEVWLDE
jgi:peptide/nickel transport system substrate-binding protein